MFITYVISSNIDSLEILNQTKSRNTKEQDTDYSIISDELSLGEENFLSINFLFKDFDIQPIAVLGEYKDLLHALENNSCEILFEIKPLPMNPNY